MNDPTAEIDRLRAAIDQAISDLRPMLAFTDDETLAEMIHHCADALYAALHPSPTTPKDPLDKL